MSKKKSKQTEHSTSSSQSTATTHNEVPDWIKNPTMQVAGNIQGILNQGPGAFAPQTSDLQQKSYDLAGSLTKSPYFDQAGEALGGIGDISVEDIRAAGILDNGLDQYYNPFKQQVLNPVLDDYDFQAGQTRAGQAAAAARGKAFQGSRYGIQEAETEGQLARGRSAAEGTLLNEMYGQATGMAEADAGRRQGASLANQQARLAAAQANQQAQLQKAQQLAALGISSGGEDRANLGILAGLGATKTDQENEARQYPLLYQAQMEGLLSGLSPELYSDRTVNQSGTSVSDSTVKRTESGSALDAIGQVAQIGSMFLPGGSAAAGFGKLGSLFGKGG